MGPVAQQQSESPAEPISEIEALARDAVALAEAGRWPELLALVESTDPPVLFFLNVCVLMKWRGDYPLLARLHQAIPQSHIVWPVALYYAGVALVAEDRHLDALALFHRFKFLMVHNVELFRPLLDNRNFNLVFRHGTMVEPPAYVRALADGSEPVEDWHPEVSVRRQAVAVAGDPIFACGLDDRYFERFAEPLVATLKARCGAAGLHFHVVCPEGSCEPQFDALAARHPEVSLGLSLDTAPLVRNASYYANARFLAMPRLVEIYDRDIVTLDADILLRHDLLALIHRLTAVRPQPDFACFHTGDSEPASVYQASIMYFANTPACRDFVGLLRLFILGKIRLPIQYTWLLDQATLFSVLAYLEQERPGAFTFQRLDEVSGLPFYDFVETEITTAEKHRLRWGQPADA